MYIIPISSKITPLDTMSQKDTPVASQPEQTPSFADVFKETFNNMEQTQQTVADDSVKLAMGDIDDMHTIYNNLTKASVALETFVTVKNAAIEAYKEIQQISM